MSRYQLGPCEKCDRLERHWASECANKDYFTRSFYVTVAWHLVGMDVLAGYPSPMLISQGGGEAWQRFPHQWRALEAGDPSGTVYTRVRIARGDD